MLLVLVGVLLGQAPVQAALGRLLRRRERVPVR